MRLYSYVCAVFHLGTIVRCSQTAAPSSRGHMPGHPAGTGDPASGRLQTGKTGRAIIAIVVGDKIHLQHKQNTAASSRAHKSAESESRYTKMCFRNIYS